MRYHAQALFGGFAACVVTLTDEDKASPLAIFREVSTRGLIQGSKRNRARFTPIGGVYGDARVAPSRLGDYFDLYAVGGSNPSFRFFPVREGF